MEQDNALPQMAQVTGPKPNCEQKKPPFIHFEYRLPVIVSLTRWAWIPLTNQNYISDHNFWWYFSHHFWTFKFSLFCEHKFCFLCSLSLHPLSSVVNPLFLSFHVKLPFSSVHVSLFLSHLPLPFLSFAFLSFPCKLAVFVILWLHFFCPVLLCAVLLKTHLADFSRFCQFPFSPIF